MAELDDLLQQIEAYFVHTEENEPDPFARLSDEEYRRYLSLVDQAIALAPDEPLLWFRRGWGLQFFGPDSSTLWRHQQFEHIETAYERVLELDPDNEPARLMLVYMHWDNARRATIEPKFLELKRQLDTTVKKGESGENNESHREEIFHLVNQASALAANPHAYYADADYSQAREVWLEPRKDFGQLGVFWDIIDSLVNARSKVDRTTHAYFNEPVYYDFSEGDGDLPLWHRLIERMGTDIMDRTHFGRYYYDFVYSYIEEFVDDEVRFSNAMVNVYKKAFEVSTHPGERADALAYLVQSHTEKFERDPREGLKYAEQFLQIAKDPAVQQDSSLRHAWLNDPETLLLELLRQSPRLRQEHASKCLELLERLIAVSKGATEHYWRYLGEFNLKLGRYKDAVEYLELTRKRDGDDDELAKNLAFAYVHTQRYDEAGAAMAAIKDRDETTELLIPIIHHTKFDTQQSSRLLEAFSKQLGRIEEQGNLTYGFLQDRDESLFSELTSLRQELSKAGPRQVDEEFVATLATQLTERVAERLDQGTRYYEEAEEECRQLWPDHWRCFPDDLQALIIHGEMLYRTWQKQKKSVDWSIVVIQWGKIAEIAFKQSLVGPLGEYLDGAKYASLTAQNNYGRRFQLERTDGDSWSTTLGKTPLSTSVGLLAAARDNDSHPISRFLKESGYSHWFWTDEAVDRMREIIEPRNKATHESVKFGHRDAAQVRGALTTSGLLAKMADELRRRKGKARR